MSEPGTIPFRAFLILAALFSLLRLPAQTFYSTDPDYIRQMDPESPLQQRMIRDYPDTSLAAFHDFFPRHFLGNYGLPSPEYLLSYGSDPLGFRLMQLPYRQDRFSGPDVRYYSPKGPYAQLTGIAGSKQLQIFRLFFTHTYRRVNVSLRFSRYTSQGFYQRQQSSTGNFYLSSHYAARSGRSGYFFYFLNNGNRHAENGGVRGDSLSETHLLQPKEIVPVRISAASRDNRQYHAQLNPWLCLNPAADSSGLRHYLSFRGSVDLNILKYRDQNMAGDRFYQLVYHDTLRTFDSTHTLKIRNAAEYTARLGHRIAFSGAYVYELNSVWQKSDSVFSNHLVNGSAVWRSRGTDDSLKKFRLENNAALQYVLAGANAGDFKIENVFLTGSALHAITVKALAERRSADYIYNRWVSNHFWWENNRFRPTHTVQALAGYSFRKAVSLRLITSVQRNYLYFDEQAHPAQYPGSVSSLAANLTVAKVFFRHLGTYLSYTRQHTNAPAYIRIPPHVITARLYYTGSHFSNNLVLQTGIQVQRYASFDAPGYMPATQVFYLRNDFRTAEYPFADLYLNARIRPVNVFLKIENLLHGFAGRDYALVPGYFQPDRAFRFGLNWMFFD